MIKTRFSELLDLKFPVVQGGMIWNSGWRLASAVSEAGGLGLIGAGSMTPELLREHVRKTSAATSRPFGVNIPLIYGQVEECLSVCREEGVRIYFTSAGSPKKHTAALKREGAKVFHVASTPDLARKCEDAGVDGVVAEGFEAGGHNGREELTTFVLVPEVVEAVRVPVLAAGGIAVGSQLAAALALGADGVQVGSRFAVSEESSAHDNFKNAAVEASAVDTFLRLKKAVPVRLLRNRFSDSIAEMEGRGAVKEELEALLGKGRARRGMFEGDLDEGELEIGQCVGLIRGILPVSAIMNNLVSEYREAAERLAGISGRSG